MLDLSLRAAAGKIGRRELSPLELTRACLERIAQLDPALNAFITVTAEMALEQARTAENEIETGLYRGPLHGIPIALKDLIDLTGVTTTAASNVFRDHPPARQDAEVVCRLKRAGAVILGKTNLQEFAYGGSSVVSAYGPTRNPHDTKRITGGSSGGSAAAVAAGMCFAAIGTDTGGSIRLPAAFCGIVGLKPTYGLVSAEGVVPLAWSFDHVGPLTRTVEDAALVLAAISDRDCRIDEDVSHLRLGIARKHFFEELDSEVAAHVEQAIAALKEITAGARDVVVPLMSDLPVRGAESWAYHAAFIAQSREKYQPPTLGRLLADEKITAAEYILGRRELERLRSRAAELFADIDVIVTPTVPMLPPTIAELEAEPARLRERELLMLRNTRPFSLLGLPAISIPCGFSAAGLPIGMQLTAAPGREDVVLALAHAAERISIKNLAARKQD